MRKMCREMAQNVAERQATFKRRARRLSGCEESSVRLVGAMAGGHTGRLNRQGGRRGHGLRSSGWQTSAIAEWPSRVAVGTCWGCEAGPRLGHVRHGVGSFFLGERAGVSFAGMGGRAYKNSIM